MNCAVEAGKNQPWRSPVGWTAKGRRTLPDVLLNGYNVSQQLEMAFDCQCEHTANLCLRSARFTARASAIHTDRSIVLDASFATCAPFRPDATFFYSTSTKN